MQVIELLCELLKFRSVTPKDDGCLEFIAKICEGWRAEFLEREGVKNLILTRKFGDGARVAFAGHVDVVPAGEGWDSDAFKPEFRDGYIYARGAQDMKSGVAAFICACLEFAREVETGGAKFNGTISLLLTSDEEGDAIYGTQEMLKILAARGELPQFAIVAEPTCEERFGDTIKIGRRGSINGKILIKGKQGHAAYPEKCVNPAHLLAGVFSKIAGRDMDGGSEFFAPSKIVITDIRGGMEVCNVTPADVKIMFNVRNSNLTSAANVEDYLRETLSGLDYDLTLKQSSKPFLTSADGVLAHKLAAAVTSVCGARPRLNTKGGTSDARYLAAYGVEVAEFGVRNDTIHAVNERVSADEVEKLRDVFLKFLREF